MEGHPTLVLVSRSDAGADLGAGEDTINVRAVQPSSFCSCPRGSCCLFVVRKYCVDFVVLILSTVSGHH